MYPVRLYRLGSDPEWVFATTQEWSHRVIPANEIITGNRALGLTTFIGTDGHQATAEVRPTPSYNVRRHLYDVAYALVATHDYLGRIPKWKGVRIMALPMVGQEPLGGHIHATFWVHDPTMKAIHDGNFLYHNGEFTSYNYEAAPGPRPLPAIFEKHAQEVNNGLSVDNRMFERMMNYFLAPLEYWIQPWGARVQRNRRYGGATTRNDNVRYSYLPRPTMERYAGWAFLHYEYRLPSTWLLHPWLAYAYLALAKLTFLNWIRIATILKKHPPKITKEQWSDEPINEKFRQQLYDRLNTLDNENGGMRYSADLRDLRGALVVLEENRSAMFEPYTGIDVEAWRKLL